MKYIKAFESVRYYYRITEEEFNSRSLVLFSKTDLLVNILNDNDYQIFDVNIWNGKNLYYEIYNNYIKIKSNKIVLFTRETRDEWFIISINYNDKLVGTDYYKCDQFDGLISFLKDSSIIS